MEVTVLVAVAVTVVVRVGVSVDVAVEVAGIVVEVAMINWGGLAPSLLEKLITLVLDVVSAKVTKPLFPTREVTSTETYPAPPNAPDEPTTAPAAGALL